MNLYGNKIKLLKNLSPLGSLEMFGEELEFILKMVPNLTSLDLSKCRELGDSACHIIAANCPHVTSLNLSQCNETSTTSLEIIADSLPNVQEYYIGDLPVTDDNLIYFLSRCTKLTHLYIELDVCFQEEEMDLLTDVSMSQIAIHCKQLRILTLKGYKKITEKSILQIIEKCNLIHTLELNHNCTLTDVTFLAIAQHCKLLKCLRSENNHKVTNNGVMEIAKNCTLLQELVIQFSRHISDESILCIAKYSHNLSVILVCGCNLITEYAIIELIKRCSKLTTVRLDTATGLDVAAITASHSCDKLAVSNIAYKFGNWIFQNNKTRGYEKSVRISCEASFVLKSSTLLTIAHLSPSLVDITLNGLKDLTDSNVITIFQSCTLLHSIILHNNPELTANVIQAAFNTCTDVKVFCMCKCIATADSDVILTAFINKFGKTLTTLQLSDTTIVTATVLANIAQNCTALTSLNINDTNSVDDCICPIIRNCTNLTHFSVARSTWVTVDTLTEISVSADKLRSLDITGCNRIRAAEITKFLNQHSMKKCQFTCEGREETV